MLFTTTIVACLAALRTQQQLVASQRFFEVVQSFLPDAIVENASIWLFILQLLGFVFGLTIVFRSRSSTALVTYVLAQGAWVLVAVVGFVLQGAPWPKWVWEAFLAIYFCVPLCSLVFACIVMCLAVGTRAGKLFSVAATLVAIGFAAEVLVILEIHAYGAAITAAIGR